jgi:gliding motility-associated-like protein
MNGVEFSRDTDPFLLIEVEGEYNIELVRTSKYGCENKMKYASIIALPKIQPVAPDKLIIAPNSFSPNGDGLNDKFQFESNFIQDIKFVVFNRWGHEIYQSDVGTGGWDGRIGNGDFASAGKYVVVYEYLDLVGRPVSKTMELNLIR